MQVKKTIYIPANLATIVHGSVYDRETSFILFLPVSRTELKTSRHNIDVFQVHELPDVLRLCSVPEQVLRPGEADGLRGVL